MASTTALVKVASGPQQMQAADTLLVGSGIKSSTGQTLSITADTGAISFGSGVSVPSLSVTSGFSAGGTIALGGNTSLASSPTIDFTGAGALKGFGSLATGWTASTSYASGTETFFGNTQSVATTATLAVGMPIGPISRTFSAVWLYNSAALGSGCSLKIYRSTTTSGTPSLTLLQTLSAIGLAGGAGIVKISLSTVTFAANDIAYISLTSNATASAAVMATLY